MQALRFLFSPSGRLSPQPFIMAAVAVYAAGVASQFLTSPNIILRLGLWPFAAAQAALIWIWFSLHAKRLHDAGRATGLAVGASLLYTLAIVLLLIIAVAFFNTSTIAASDANTSSALGLLLVLSIVAILLGSPNYDFSWLIVVILVVMALLPVIVVLAVTLWAGTRPSAEEHA